MFELNKNDMYINSRYVYLDWNVFKYMKEPRRDKVDLDLQFKNLFFKLKRKYKIPFSYAHIKDRANHYSKEYYEEVKEDFKFVETVTDSVYIEIYEDSPVLCKKPIQILFDIYVSEQKRKNDFPNNLNPFPFSFEVDVEKIDKEHPMYDFIMEKNGLMSNDTMDEWLILEVNATRQILNATFLFFQVVIATAKE